MREHRSRRRTGNIGNNPYGQCAMAGPRCFPPSDHTMWTNSLTNLPQLSDETLGGLCTMATTSSKQQSKSYVFAVEAYTVPSSVRTNICDSSLGTIYGRAVCYRSQKKTGMPYNVLLAFKADTGIKPMSVQDVDWRSSREGGVEMAMPVQLYDARAEKQKDEQQLQSFHALGRGLENIGNFDFASVLLAARRQSVETKLGPAPAGSPMSYQQAQLPAGFTTWMSDNIVMGAGTDWVFSCISGLSSLKFSAISVESS
ncbi:hypothetical protein HPB47_001052 [Ixodes persulcatus]|uniref:Uncharacterized protein n=1 Tax=Ixodes persulcatus TaxID=34615 RepID=A0AC60PQ33_IXOPE|nr:hypothetical protein HPB47_001052 [Ixodes persulcatus]